MNPKRGRPASVDPSKIKEVILKYKEIINNNNNVISKTHDIWNIIARELENKITSNGLYVFVMFNRYGVKNAILNKEVCNDKCVSASESLLSNSSSNWNEVSITSSPDVYSENAYSEKHLVISLLKEDFTNLLVEKIYKRREKGKMYYRLRKVLQPGKWQELITNKFWEATHMKCGFQFKNHYISADEKTGVINGKIVMNSKILENSENFVNLIIAMLE